MSGKSPGLLLYQQAVIADIEATSLGRESNIIEASFFRVKDGNLAEYHLAPNLTKVELGVQEQDAARLRSSSTDSVRFLTDYEVEGGQPRPIDTEKKALAQQLLLEEQRLGLNIKAAQDGSNTVEYLLKNEKQFLKRLEVAMPYQHSTVIGYKFPRISDQFSTVNRPTRPPDPYSLGPVVEQKKRELARAGKYSLVQNATMQQFLNEGLARHAQESVIWIANVNYEGKQIGAKMAAFEADYRRSMVIKSIGEDNAAARFRQEGLADDYVDNLIENTRKKTRAELRAEFLDMNKNISPVRLALLETNINTTDAFSVTGKEVNRAIAQARISGDWRQVYQAYRSNTRAGDVRDIMDVIRAQISYSKEMGLIKSTKINNLSMDTAYRLYGASIAETPEEAMRFLKTPEFHSSAADVLITENLVLRSSLAQTEALYQAEKDPNIIKNLIRNFDPKSTDDLTRAIKFGRLIDQAQFVEQHNVQKRLHRALKDLVEIGQSTQATNEVSLRLSDRVRYDNMDGKVTSSIEQVQVAQTARYETYTNIDDVFDHIRRSGNYAEHNIEIAIQAFQEHANYDSLAREAEEVARGKAIAPAARLVAIGRLAEMEKDMDDTLKKHFNDMAVNLNLDRSVTEGAVELQNRARLHSRVSPKYKAMEVSAARILKYKGLYGVGIMAGIGAIGLVSDTLFGNASQRTGDANLRTMNYHRWLEMNQEYAGLYDPTKDTNGMNHAGIAAEMRKDNTDFGSPYSGPTYSSYVFENQKLLQEREKYTRELFSKRHFSHEGDIGAYLLGSAPSRIRHRVQMSGSKVDSGNFAGLRSGLELVSLDMNKYNIEVEDADTIVLKRRGMGNFVSSMFGLNDTGSVIRLAGIDAPETAHAGRQAMAYGEMSKATLKSMLENAGSIEVVADPTNITYGRAVGSVFVDGQNVATQMLKRGLVAHLPFNKKGTQSMQSDRIYSEYQTLAQGMDYNMWGNAGYRVYEDFVKKSGKTITFNTLVNPEKVAKNGTQLSLASMMASAQEMGFYNNAMQHEIASISKIAREKGFGSDWSTPILNHNTVQKSHKGYMNYLIRDVTNHMATRGNIEPYSSGVARKSKLDKELVLDTMGTSNSVYSKSRYEAYNLYKVNSQDRMYKAKMAAAQRDTLKQMNQSPIGHWRM